MSAHSPRLRVARHDSELDQAAFGFASPRTLPALHCGTVVYVDDVDAHCRHARAAGAKIEREPQDQDYGVREYTARDREGNQWFSWTPL